MNKKIKRIIPFTTLQKINKKINGRPIVLFGVGRIAKKTMRFLTNQKITTVVDNASNLWGEIDNGIRVMSPEFLKSKKGKESFIIICTTSFAQVTNQLIDLGFSSEDDFYVSLILIEYYFLYQHYLKVSKNLLYYSHLHNSKVCLDAKEFLYECLVL